MVRASELGTCEDAPEEYTYTYDSTQKYSHQVGNMKSSFVRKRRTNYVLISHWSESNMNNFPVISNKAFRNK